MGAKKKALICLLLGAAALAGWRLWDIDHFYRTLLSAASPFLTKPEGVPKNATPYNYDYVQHPWGGGKYGWGWERSFQAGISQWSKHSFYNDSEIYEVRLHMRFDGQHRPDAIVLSYSNREDLMFRRRDQYGLVSCELGFGTEDMRQIQSLVASSRSEADTKLEIEAHDDIANKLSKVLAERLHSGAVQGRTEGCFDRR